MRRGVTQKRPTGREGAGAGAVGDSHGDGEQSSADGLGHDGTLVAGAEPAGPAHEVVGDSREHAPGSVGVELTGGAVGHAGALFEVADGELDHRVSAVIHVEFDGGAGAIGDERVVAPQLEQRRLGALMRVRRTTSRCPSP